MVRTLKCSPITTTDGYIWGTASQWTTNDHSSTWNFTRTYVLIRMVRCYEHLSWLYWMHLFEVPVIAVFTKYDQFLRNVGMQLADYPDEYPDGNVSDVAEKLFQEYYLHPLGDDFGYVRLESGFRVNCQVYFTCWCSLAEMHREDGRCDKLIENTAMALNEDIVTLMLLAVQRGNLELSVKIALNRWVPVCQSKGWNEQISHYKLQCPLPCSVWSQRYSSGMSCSVSIHLGKCY